MFNRTPIVGGNWKMNTDLASARSLAGEVVVASRELTPHCEIVLFPPFPYIATVGDVIRGTDIRLGAQDVHHKPNGAYTGSVSAAMLVNLDVTHVLIGHSERRHAPEGVAEGDRLINLKLKAALEAGLTAVLCLGETLEQREAGKTEEITLSQLDAALEGVSADAAAQIVLAYEPVWAIGTGRNATPEDAQAVHRLLRQRLGMRYNEELARATRIQYGGSVKGSNASSLFSQPDIDGGLIGGASLNSEEFLTIVRAAAETVAA
ncbi:MAG TPA: triose-phosphate isomerase [Phycisphaerales bacterium]|nr:triose-phosphate isomerase [Phycisphaerales bacterium]